VLFLSTATASTPPNFDRFDHTTTVVRRSGLERLLPPWQRGFLCDSTGPGTRFVLTEDFSFAFERLVRYQIFQATPASYGQTLPLCTQFWRPNGIRLSPGGDQEGALVACSISCGLCSGNQCLISLHSASRQPGAEYELLSDIGETD